MDKRIYRGPKGVTVILDPKEIVPNDPGQGTPAMVNYRGMSATYTCAVNAGEVEYQGRTVELPQDVIEWLDELQEFVDKFYDDFYAQIENKNNRYSPRKPVAARRGGTRQKQGVKRDD